MAADNPDLKAALAGVYDRSAPTYDRVRYFHRFAELLVQAADPSPGERLLDVACGRAAVLLRAAQRVVPGPVPVGVDLSLQMLRETRAAAAHSAHAAFALAGVDAERLAFRDCAFNCLTCSFAMQFFPDLPGALREFHRVLKPSGRVAANAWGPPDPEWEWFDELRARHGARSQLKSQDLREAGPLADRFRAAGFERVEVAQNRFEIVFSDEAEWWETHWAVSGRSGLERLGEAALKRLEDETAERLGSLRQPDGFHMTLRAHLVSGRKPANL